MVDHTRRGTQRAESREGSRGHDDDATSRDGSSSWRNEACCAVAWAQNAEILRIRNVAAATAVAAAAAGSATAASLCGFQQYYVATTMRCLRRRRHRRRRCRRCRQRRRRRRLRHNVECGCGCHGNVWLALGLRLTFCGHVGVARLPAAYTPPHSLRPLLRLSLGLSEMKRPCVRAGSHCRWASSSFPFLSGPFLPIWHDTA